MPKVAGRKILELVWKVVCGGGDWERRGFLIEIS